MIEESFDDLKVGLIKSIEFAKNIIEFFQKNGMILTGSLALRKAGTMYRSVKEDLHDLDFTLELSEFRKQLGYTINNKLDIAEKLQQNIDVTEEFQKEIKKTDFYKNIKDKFPTFKVLNIFNGLQKGDITLWCSIDDKYSIDVFVITKRQTNLSTEEKSFQNWIDIFKAKLRMGRDKDIRDFVNYTPFNKNVGKIASEAGFRHFTFNKKQVEKVEEPKQTVYYNLSDPNYLLLSKENQKKLKELQNKGLISTNRVSKGVNYTVPKLRTGNQNNRGIGNSEFIVVVNKVKQLKDYIANNDIKWLKLNLTANEAVVKVIPGNQWELPLKPETKDTNQDKTTTELLTKLKSIIDRLGIKLEKVDAIYEAQQEINSLNKKENKTYD